MRISELIAPQSVLLRTNITWQDNALAYLVELLERGGGVTNGTACYHAMRTRESIGGSTAIGEGIAIPHASNAGVERAGISVLTLRNGLDWGAADGQLVDMLFMVAVPPGQESQHLQILARLVNLLANAKRVEAIRRTRTPQDFLHLLTTAEKELFGG